MKVCTVRACHKRHKYVFTINVENGSTRGVGSVLFPCSPLPDQGSDVRGSGTEGKTIYIYTACLRTSGNNLAKLTC